MRDEDRFGLPRLWVSRALLPKVRRTVSGHCVAVVILNLGLSCLGQGEEVCQGSAGLEQGHQHEAGVCLGPCSISVKRLHNCGNS